MNRRMKLVYSQVSVMLLLVVAGALVERVGVAITPLTLPRFYAISCVSLAALSIHFGVVGKAGRAGRRFRLLLAGAGLGLMLLVVYEIAKLTPFL